MKTSSEFVTTLLANEGGFHLLTGSVKNYVIILFSSGGNAVDRDLDTEPLNFYRSLKVVGRQVSSSYRQEAFQGFAHLNELA